MSRVAPAGQFAHAPRGAEFGGVGWFCDPRFWQSKADMHL